MVPFLKLKGKICNVKVYNHKYDTCGILTTKVNKPLCVIQYAYIFVSVFTMQLSYTFPE